MVGFSQLPPGQGAEGGRGDPEGLQRPGGCGRGPWLVACGNSRFGGVLKLGDPQNHRFERFEYWNSLIWIYRWFGGSIFGNLHMDSHGWEHEHHMFPDWEPYTIWMEFPIAGQTQGEATAPILTREDDQIPRFRHSKVLLTFVWVKNPRYPRYPNIIRNIAGIAECLFPQSYGEVSQLVLDDLLGLLGVFFWGIFHQARSNQISSSAEALLASKARFSTVIWCCFVVDFTSVEEHYVIC